MDERRMSRAGRRARCRAVALVGSVLVAGLVACAVPVPPEATPVDDGAAVALDVVPAGAYSPPSTADVGREARMYDSLTPLGGDVTDADLRSAFKPMSLEFPDGEEPTEVVRPRDGVEIRRDGYGVPYVTATTDRDALWAVGWLGAAHAPLLYDVVRRNARMSALDVPGQYPLDDALRMRLLTPSPEAEAELARQVADFEATGPEARAVMEDVDAYVAGYNAKLDADLSFLPRLTRNDAVAAIAAKRGWLGGGRTQVAAPAPGAAGPPADGAVGIPQPTRYRAAEASNFAIVAGNRSATGHPMLIGGPQIGLMYPGITFEVVVNSPHIKVRGLTAPSYPGYVFVGRTERFAWTVNSALDAVGAVQVPVRMCGDGWSSYELDGRCVPVEEVPVGDRLDLNDPVGGSGPVVLRRTAYGPLDWVDTWSGTGWVVQRPAAGHDLEELRALRRVNLGQTSGPQEFREAMQLTPQAFYVGYVDAHHVQAFQTCWCARTSGAVPARDVQELRVPAGELPTTVDPARGVVTNWNEQLVTTPDGDFVPPTDPSHPWSGEEKQDWYRAFDAARVHTPASLVGTMNRMAVKWTVDGVNFMPYASPGQPMPFSTPLAFLGGPSPAPVTATDRSQGIQMVVGFDR